MTDWIMTHIEEPLLSFGFNQKTEHPKDGLFLYGPPASNQNPARMDVGVIGTPHGIRRYESWVKAMSRTIAAPEKGREENKTMWPGFQATFGIPWPAKPFATITIDGDVLSNRIRTEDRHEAIFKAVTSMATPSGNLREQEARPQFWFAIIPEEIFRYGRPKSVVPKGQRVKATGSLGHKAAKSILSKGSMFIEEMEAAALYEYELNFHNQLKARLLDTGQVLQVVRETTLTPPNSTKGCDDRCRTQPRSPGISPRPVSIRREVGLGAWPMCARVSATSVWCSKSRTPRAATMPAAEPKCS